MVGKRKNLNAASKFMKTNIGKYQKRKRKKKWLIHNLQLSIGNNKYPI